ncbi:MAG: alpha/beta fold hydrolase [Pyrinomonadaceae bacterium]
MITDERIDLVVRPLKGADAHRALLATSRSWDAGRIEQDAALIGQPTLIIWGEDDKVISIENGHKLHDAILHSRFVVFRNCGHVPMEEKSELFSELVTEFCRNPKSRIANEALNRNEDLSVISN